MSSTHHPALARNGKGRPLRSHTRPRRPIRRSRLNVAVLGSTLQEVVDRLLAPFKQCGFSRKTIAHNRAGNLLWVVHETQYSENTLPVRTLYCYVIRKSLDGRWGYEVRAERAGIPYTSCPVELLAEAPVMNSKWRADVLARRNPVSTDDKAGDILSTDA